MFDREGYYLSEVERVQNPAFGANLIWNYGRSYQSNISAEPSHILLTFLILPICFHRPTLDLVKGTWAQSGFGKFCEKLGEKREELFAVHERCLELREVTLSSVSFGERSGLFMLNYGTAQLQAMDVKEPNYPERIRDHVKCAHKLGTWFSDLSAAEIFHALRVEA